MKVFATLRKIALAILGVADLSKNAEGKFELSAEQKTKLTDALGEAFVAKFETAIADENGGDHTAELIDALTASASKPDPQVAQLQAQLDQERKTKETLQTTIMTLSKADEPEPPAREASAFPRKEGAKSLLKVDLKKPVYQALAAFGQTGIINANAGTIEVGDLISEFGTYLSQGRNNFDMIDTIFQGFTSAPLFTERPAVTEWRGIQALITSVSQQFVPKWTPSGKSEFRPLKIENRRHKINMPIVPSDVMTSYIFDMYRENLAPDQMPIFMYIWQRLLYPQLLQDIELRMAWKGRFTELNYAAVNEGDAGQAPEQSMDGIETQLVDNLTAGNPKNFRYFDLDGFDLDTATDQEILDLVKNFMKWMAPVFRTMPLNVCCSYEFRMRYREAYKNKWGAGSGTENHEFGSDRIDYTRGVLKEVDGMYGSPILFATPKANLIKLRHINQAPNVINDVQKNRYAVEIFGEYWMGLGFGFGEAVFAAVPAGYDPYAKITEVYGASTTNQQYKGTNPDYSLVIGSGSAGGGI